MERIRGLHQTTSSRDGTPIAFWRRGDGPPLLLVHGSTADHTTTWASVRAELEGRFSVCAMDRRGRGGSGDTDAYSLSLEAEDVASVVDRVGELMHVLGHSHGALCALEAALLTPRLKSLILYEGVPLRGSDDLALDVVDRMEAMLAAGDVEDVLVTLLRDVVGMPQREVDLLRSQRSAWNARLSNARTVPRELRAHREYVFAPQRFENVTVPVLLLVGENSPRRELENARSVAAALPNAEIALLSGQEHVAMHSAPGRFVSEIAQFIEGLEGSRRGVHEVRSGFARTLPR